jgi:peptidoglycan/LPS O-acetylase OafA/YrhL
MALVDQVIDRGWLSVTLFFVLSGFVLACGESRRPSRPARFWRARFARIYPAYALGLLLLLPAQHLAGSGFLASTGYVAVHVLLLQAWSGALALTWNFPGWSLSAEAFFYAVFPFWLRLARRVDRGREGAVVIAVFAAYAACGAVYLLVTGRADWSPGFQYAPIARIGEFLVGCSLGRRFLAVETWNGGPPRSDARRGAIMLLIACCGLAALVCIHRVPSVLLNSMLLVPVFALVVYGLALVPRLPLLSSPALQLLGGASYALYILHNPLMHWADVLWPGGGRLRFLVYTVSSVVIAVAVFRCYEEPMRRRLMPRRRA